ncbi:MAG: hypothetical protein ACYC3I_23760 [Gemmataceae bacterium]
MRCFHCAACCLIVLMLGVAQVRAETPPSPQPSPPSGGEGRVRRAVLRLMPDRADFLVQAPQPRRLIESLTSLDKLKQFQQLEPVREFLDSTNARRFFQLVAYFEKELGLPWPQLLDRLASRGVVFGVEIGPNPAPVLLVIEGEDEQLMQQFFQLGLRIVEQELTRQEVNNKIVKGLYKSYNIAHFGNEFYAAVAGGALLLSNSEKALHAGLNRHQSGGKKSMADVPGIREAARLMPPQPLVTLWLNLDKAHQSEEGKAVFKPAPRNDGQTTVLVGHYFNLLGRSPFVCAALHGEGEELAASLFLPRGREGMGADRLLHIPPSGVPASRPLLKPKSVLYSESGYFDIANIWKERATLFNEKQTRALEKFNKQSAPFLLGAKLSKLLTQTGPYYRFVAAHQSKTDYKTTPKISIPAFALVWELRQPEEFGKSIEPILRGVALLGGFEVHLQIVEEQYKGCKLIGYRFPEDKPLKGDINDLRYNFTPCFTRVGDQFVASSTIELCRELVDLLHEESSAPTRGDASPARFRIHGAGAAAYLRTIEDLLFTQIVLDQAATPREARQRVKAFLDFIQGLGTLAFEPHYEEKTFRYDLHLIPAKKD